MSGQQGLRRVDAAAAAASPAWPARALPFLAIFATAFAVRSVTWPSVVTPIGVVFPTIDDLYYHLRRIWYATVNFPDVIAFDPYVSYPNGAEIVWPPLFDGTLAVLARLFVGAGSQEQFEQFVIWLAPAIGAAVAVLAAVVAGRAFGRQAGWWAGGLCAVMPASFLYTQLGQLDHHGAVALLTTAMLGAAMASIRRHQSHRRAASAAAGLGMAAVILLWPGALLHVGVVQAVLGIWWLSAADRETAVERGVAVALGQATCALVLAPFGLGRSWAQYGGWSPLVLSNFQPVYFAAVAVGMAAATAIFARTPLGGTRKARIGSALALGLLVAAAALAVLPPVREALVYAAGWFSREEAFQTHVSELRPLYVRGGQFDPTVALQRFSFLLVALPVLLVWLVVSAWKRASAPRFLLAAWTVVFLLLAILQIRFSNTFSVAYTIVCGGGVAAFLDLLRSGRPRVRGLRVGAWVATVAVALLTLDTMVSFYAPYLDRGRRGLQDERVRRVGLLPGRQVLFDAAGRWMAARTPPTRGYLDVTVRPEYGVLASWEAGHLLRYRSRRPMVQDNFGVYGGRETYEAAWRYYLAEDEEAAVSILDHLGVRYVVADARGPGMPGRLPEASMASRLNDAYGSETRLADGRVLPALSRHRLVFHAHTDRAGHRGGPLAAQAPHASLGVWERVEGARVQGSAPPNARVTATLDLSTPTGRRHRYRAGTRATAEGRYSLILPYPNERFFGTAVRAADHYLIETDGASAPVFVTEEAVVGGRTVEGPAL